ncbi:ATP-dependent helicase [Bradyrhizobium japonicum]|uniref:ATP-dependent helicase n=1 Tax=Bradyrhizobium japonicum TaxID=375 RepID=UPI00209CD8F2|nr:ATP-dependent DNA helicase [Bradyrhizobium japonicum]MCP1768666.1 DNA helicase-2/ATP-dependent DNA helicase PcrA [Bradyrhizobium japonicum]MCP1794336.1 DNA helicase-2/ATP-dependent DNA helicase PcrA [Bradyrhizobium japonicum]MCP1811394.1 DNA helicase-2/ATP-dependent DNA helicase PcrA [Bradyrhizobium japonicum]MCP1821239.1 DNA helicase-2/ATP-dependent DNA helicase PcrA [Bradyrhizobium japonicum]MCP1876275.1 DNA helicase-2/ATP-dependent DNA helicase PcrA [Bradyrhizobium japonicum]
MELTVTQEKAVIYGGRNLQLIACAGSGKTEVVARRVVQLLTPNGSQKLLPGNIIAFTFTEKAAAELKERIVTRTREALGDISGMAEMFVGTIHAFCLELLKSESPKYLKYEVLNEVQQTLFVDRHSKASGLTQSTTLTGQPLKRYIDTRHFITALNILREDRPTAPDRLEGNTIVAQLSNYEQLLHDRGYLDYSSILKEAVTELKGNQSLRERLSARIRHVIVDEYQDVNPVQESVVEELHRLGAGICVVGDDDQTIYQWRGSDVRNILSFEGRYPGATQVRLEENFRSSEGVVAVGRDFIRQVLRRLPKEMKNTGAQAYEPNDITALSFDTPEEEAQHIARTCVALRGIAIREDGGDRGISWSDVAILLRSVRRDGEAIMSALEKAGVPYVITGMDDLFQTDEAEAARQLFYFLAHEIDEAALRAAWQRADLGIASNALDRAVAAAVTARQEMKQADVGQFKVYNLQRQFIAFIENAGLREERVPDGRGEVVFYNLGKFSQAISDFESIHFRSAPVEKYASFAGFLRHHAESAYPEGWQDNAFVSPDAVRIMTVHQSKGLQWPVVFIPQLVRNRFPSRAVGGRTAWHLIPEAAFDNAVRYKGGLDDERRLFYVAVTRAQKFLHMSWAPHVSNQAARAPSDFYNEVLASKYVKRRPPDYSERKRLDPRPKSSVANVTLSFSDLKYFFECPYQFKLRILYGFNAPLDEALGFGKSLHDALAEIHARALRGEAVEPGEAAALVQRHLRAPYAYPALREKLEQAARRVIESYIHKNASQFKNLEFSEKVIEIALGDGVSVAGRIDLVRRIDTGEVTIVDLKSNDRAQTEMVTETQLHIYALGYQELTGRSADYVEIYELDDQKQKRRSVDDDFIADVKRDVRTAASALRSNNLPAKPRGQSCGQCDYRRLCTAAITT